MKNPEKNTYLLTFSHLLHTYLYFPSIPPTWLRHYLKKNCFFYSLWSDYPCLRVKLHLQAPEMQDDLISTFTPSCHALVSFSIGYFIYDALDMVLYHRSVAHEFHFHLEHLFQSCFVGSWTWTALKLLLSLDNQDRYIFASIEKFPLRKRSTYELLVHHFMVITCLGIAVSTRRVLFP